MRDNTTKCALCGIGTLNPMIGINIIDFDGIQENLEYHYSICDECGGEQAGKSHIYRNKQIMEDFKIKHKQRVLK